jgi:hypothetical protein
MQQMRHEARVECSYDSRMSSRCCSTVTRMLYKCCTVYPQNDGHGTSSEGTTHNGRLQLYDRLDVERALQLHWLQDALYVCVLPMPNRHIIMAEDDDSVSLQ